jgi:2-polyprenyl-3-methyl-5-hydroxy-6-metoxy-1,4-benzoquinol methylase
VAVSPASEQLEAAAQRYFGNAHNRGHYQRDPAFSAGDLAAHVEELIGLRCEDVRRWQAELAPHVGAPPRRILDAGCGPGFTAAALSRCHPEAEVVGVDIEEEAVALARSIAPADPRLSFSVAPLEEIDAALGSFDLIVCRTTLEHVYDPRRSLERLVDRLAPGGLALVETPNYLHPFEPHVNLPMLPKGPKWLLRLECRLTGRDAGFVDHLRFEIDARSLPRWAREDGRVAVVDLNAEKVRRILGGAERSAVGRRQRLIDLLTRIPGARRALLALAPRVPIWPSVRLLLVRRAG